MKSICGCRVPVDDERRAENLHDTQATDYRFNLYSNEVAVGEMCGG